MKLLISVADQVADLYDDEGVLIRRYRVSTAANGVGERAGSYCTPRGRHRVRAKIGAGLPLGAVLVGRRPTGEVIGPSSGAGEEKDWILTRILWLSGCEPGFNRLGEVDSMRRYIYLHGTPATDRLGTPVSHGCIRFSNEDIAELFELLPVGAEVVIGEAPAGDGFKPRP